LVNSEFLDTIKRAKSRVEMYYEEHLVESNVVGTEIKPDLEK